jgi:hypothetical protein
VRPLPLPATGASINELRKFLNVKTNEDFVLAVSFQLAALRPTGPYPLLNLMGPPGLLARRHVHGRIPPEHNERH